MRELLFRVTKKDFRIDFFRSGGKGGQNQNKRDTGARITHIESGAVGESRTHRTQSQNLREAFKRLREDSRWKIWFNRKVLESIHGKEVEKEVDRMMEDIQIEYKGDGKWVVE